MADDVTVDNGGLTDYDVATDDDGSGNHVQIVKLAQSADASRTPISADANGLLVNLGSNNDVTISDGGNSITVDDGATTLSVDDGGSSLTVDGTVGVSGTVTVDSELTTADLDTGAGTDTRAVVGLVGSKSGGGALIPGDATSGLKVDLGSDNDVTVTSGTITTITNVVHVDDNSSTLSVDDGAGSLTVDNTVLSVTGGGAESGAQRVTIASDSTGVISVDDNGSSLTVDNGGTFVTQENGSALTALQLIDDTIFADDAAFTVGTHKVSVGGFLADESSTDSVDEGDVGAARMTLDRKLRTVQTPHTSGGLSIFRTLDADETEEDVKTSAGQLFGWYIYNDGAAEVYVKLYNATAANVTVGSTTPVMTIPIPAGSAANVEYTNGIEFGTAISIAATTGVADSDTTAPSANQVIANIFYK